MNNKIKIKVTDDFQHSINFKGTAKEMEDWFKQIKKKFS